MKRRQLLKQIGLATGLAATTITHSMANPGVPGEKKKRLRIAHITDVHIRPEYDAPKRFKKCMDAIKAHKPDFFLNGGDSIYAADYSHVTRERVQQQWEIWNSCMGEINDYEIFSCLGNHDMWWAAPDKQDPMYGKNYVVKQLKVPNRYYSFDKQGWHFIVLDSNNQNAGSLDDEQRIWLEDDLAKLPSKTPVLVLSHYPLLAACTNIDGGMHTDYKYLVDLFFKHRDKVKVCISGHVHLQDRVVYNDVHYYCNGALSGYWWEDGDKDSAGKYYYQQTPPGYSIIDLYADGTVENSYIAHAF